MTHCRFRLAALLLLCLTMMLPATAAESGQRPRVGLVLGGGGARGAAHIGVLEVLDELRVPVDCVAGTSMGALVAGAFAAGVSPAEMRKQMAATDWDDMFDDNPDQSALSYRHKQTMRRFLPGTETGVSADGMTYKSGVVGGQKIKLFLNRLVNADRGERRIEALGLPLSIIATDIGTGERVVFRDGRLTSAMRASMSVPGLMAPYETAGHKLVDGGLVDNLPVAEVRELCHADVVIAVNVGSPLMKAEEIGSLFSVTAQMINILTEQNVSHSLALLGPADVYLKPDLDGIDATEFAKYADAARRGRVAAETSLARLQALSVDESEYAAWSGALRRNPKDPQTVDAVDVVGLEHVNPEAVRRHLSVAPGMQADATQLDDDMGHIFGDGWYESVDYALSNRNGRNTLRVSAVEKHWGPDYVRFGLNLDSNFRNDASYTLRGQYEKTWLNALGGELAVTADLGRESRLGIDLYQPIDAQQRHFIDASFSAGRENLGIYQDDHKLADYSVKRRTFALGAGVNLGNLGQLRAGWRLQRVNADLGTGLPSDDFPAQKNADSDGGYVILDLDQIDQVNFPTAGWAAKVTYFNSPKEGYAKLTADVRAAHTVGDYVLNGRASYQGAVRGNLPVYDAGSLGGFLNLSGFVSGQLMGDDMRYGGLRLERIIGRLPLGLHGDLRAGVALEAAKVGVPYTETRRTGWISATSVYLGGETPLGPVYIGYGRSSAGNAGAFLFVGTP